MLPVGVEFEFLRTRGLADDVPQGYSYWKNLTDGTEGWLSASDVQQLGLIEQMREGVNKEIEKENAFRTGSAMAVDEAAVDRAAGRKTPRKPHGGPSVTTESPDAGPGPDEHLEVVGGSALGWRWQRVEDGDDVLWVIDNKDAAQLWDANGATGLPELHHIVLPEEVLVAILETSVKPRL